MTAAATARSIEHDDKVIAGHKAVLKNTKTSIKAKEKSRNILADYGHFVKDMDIASSSDHPKFPKYVSSDETSNAEIVKPLLDISNDKTDIIPDEMHENERENTILPLTECKAVIKIAIEVELKEKKVTGNQLVLSKSTSSDKAKTTAKEAGEGV